MRNSIMQLAQRPLRRVAVATIGVVLAGAGLLVSAPTAAAATSVNCSTTNLQSAIDSTAPGARLIVTGTCLGDFTISQDLTLIGQGTAVLDGEERATTLTVSSGAAVTIAGLSITHGSGFSFFRGGGITNAGTLTLKEVTVTNNIAILGGGIFNRETGTMTVDDSTVNGNAAPSGGGGIVDDRGAMTLNDTRVSGNTAREAGGIILFGGSLTLKDSTVSGNTAGLPPGGILDGGTLTLTDSTVTGNSPFPNCDPFGEVPGCSG